MYDAQTIKLYLTKPFITFIAIVFIWNVTKLPFYMAFNNDGNEYYNSHGVELSINLGHFVKGYRSLKMRTPPCNFLLVHAGLGLTQLGFMMLSLINTSWRKKYCIPFFIMAILHGFHIMPAAWINDGGFTPLFMTACILLIAMGVWGLYTKSTYEKDPELGEKNFMIQYSAIAFINYAAAFLEVPNIMKAFKSKSEDGEFKSYGDEPHKLWGHTPYSVLPEKVGMTVFLALILIVWFAWPLYLLQFAKPDKKDDRETVNETTSLVA